MSTLRDPSWGEHPDMVDGDWGAGCCRGGGGCVFVCGTGV